MLLRLLCTLARPQPFRDIVEEVGALVTALAPKEDLRRALAAGSFDLVLVDERTLGRRGAPKLGELREHPDRPEAIVVVEQEDAVARARLLAEGALAVIYRKLDPDAARAALRTLLERRREEVLARRSAGGPDASEALDEVIAESPAMRACLEVARRVADADSSLLLLGETGAGKEHLARAIHASGPRARAPFVAVNCAALPEGLLESELFGHLAGAFTGATRPRRGQFELAHRGTLFLDEVGELPLHLQSKLLRALQERRIQPLGAERELAVDVRVIAATNRDLEAEVAARRFRADLYYRLAVVTLTLPPLRERATDLPRLAERCLAEARARLKRPTSELTPEALALMAAYPWPGNVRELANVLERALLLARDGRIGAAELPDGLRPAGRRGPSSAGRSARAPEPALTPVVAAPAGDADPLALPWREAREHVLQELEQRYFRALLERAEGRVGDAARLAGMDPRSLYAKMRQLGLRKEEFRGDLTATGGRAEG